jgi:hypothetical protein
MPSECSARANAELTVTSCPRAPPGLLDAVWLFLIWNTIRRWGVEETGLAMVLGVR